MNQLDQLRNLCRSALALSSAKIRKSFETFFIQAMIIYATSFNRINFSQMARLSSSCEQRFRQNFEKEFDWITFNKFYLSMLPLKRIAIAIDPSYITKSGKCTLGLSYFWSSAAGMAKLGLEILGFAVVDADSKEVKLFNESEDKRRPSNYLASNFDILKHILLFGVKKAA